MNYDILLGMANAIRPICTASVFVLSAWFVTRANIKKSEGKRDIIIAALGSPKFLKADMVKDGVTIIDVGTTRVPAPETKTGFRLSGDVDFENVAPKCSYITPVPGGVGPMTICSLLKNTLLAGKKAIYK